MLIFENLTLKFNDFLPNTDQPDFLSYLESEVPHSNKELRLQIKDILKRAYKNLLLIYPEIYSVQEVLEYSIASPIDKEIVTMVGLAKSMFQNATTINNFRAVQKQAYHALLRISALLIPETYPSDMNLHFIFDTIMELKYYIFSSIITCIFKGKTKSEAYIEIKSFLDDYNKILFATEVSLYKILILESDKATNKTANNQLGELQYTTLKIYQKTFMEVRDKDFRTQVEALHKAFLKTGNDHWLASIRLFPKDASNYNKESDNEYSSKRYLAEEVLTWIEVERIYDDAFLKYFNAK